MYEAQVNYELRNFNQLEGQVGADVYNEGKQNSKLATATRRKKLATGLVAFAALLFLAGAITWFVAERNHTSTSNQTSADSDEHQTRQDGTTEISLAPLTVTSHITTTHMATITVIQTTTAPIPTSIVQAAKSFFDSIHSVEASIHSSAESALSEALTFPTSSSATPPAPTTAAPTTLATTTSTLGTSPLSGHLICGGRAGCITIAGVLSTSTEPASPEPTVATSSAALIGFCSVPGMFCERDLTGMRMGLM